MTTPTRIVIAGGGFAGLYTALELEQAFARDDRVEITLVDQDNFFLFTPMLAEVVSGGIEPYHIVSPLRAFLRKVRFRDSAVHAIDLERRVLTASHCPRCEPYALTYDHLILAPGSCTNFFGLPGVAEHAFPMRTLADALALRNHVIDVLEHADLEPNPEGRRPLCTVVVAGGGLAGVETIAELHDFARRATRFYPHIRPEEIRMVLAHPGERLMPEINDQLAAYAQQQLTRRKARVRLKTKIVRASADAVELSDGTVIPSSTLVWTAGTSVHPLVAGLPCQKDERGRILVDEFLEVPDIPGVWAAGDCAHIPDPKTGQPHPPTAQHAVREGRQAGRNIVATIRGGGQTTLCVRHTGAVGAPGAAFGGGGYPGMAVSGLLRLVAVADDLSVQAARAGPQNPRRTRLDAGPVLSPRYHLAEGPAEDHHPRESRRPFRSGAPASRRRPERACPAQALIIGEGAAALRKTYLGEMVWTPIREEARMRDPTSLVDALQDTSRLERSPDPCAMVIFGASGDLTRRKLMPALYQLARQELLPHEFSVVGFARSQMSHDAFRDKMKREVAEFSRTGSLDEAVWDRFTQGLFYLPAESGGPASYQRLAEMLATLDRDRGTGGNRVFYLAVPPSAYAEIIRQLGAAGLARSPNRGWTRIIIEKPFGRDLDTARGLNRAVGDIFAEDQVYRIDHYLGKETVQNILVFRLASGIFEPIWNRRYIDHVQITVAERLGVEGRGAYYDEAGSSAI